ncbi:TonB-dependent receptor plug domain-containing protein [Gluconacetobacter asukensis]|uniref:TonB-dependent receptor n=1 Tax=Gluconacetobacter asukensis TaxID=1017181 RepID=A0A7W4IZ00_9PROT|nr:TonB-dependent receptor [Gluconacetobacter asukensis]MBB2171649.1 TonB-dependent receptor [Gluconacetobacter asukensis]
MLLQYSRLPQPQGTADIDLPAALSAKRQGIAPASFGSWWKAGTALRPVTCWAVIGLFAASATAPARAATGTSDATGTGSVKASAPAKAKARTQPKHKADADEQVIVTGTRAPNRHARQSSSPITVVTAATLARTGLPNLAEALARTYPSINIQAMGQNADALTSSIRMRGLNPNHVLVLVDGVRRHTSANISTGAGVNFGSTPTDLNMIPAAAIDHIEVLEDGAAALYGSDAIAGVVNIITKKKPSGLHVSATTGANAYLGDGWTAQLDADGGIRLGDDGYLHLSGQYMHRDDSVIKAIDHRLIENQAPAGAYTGSAYTGSLPVPLYSNQVTNVPEETRESLALSFGKPLTDKVEGYGLITYAHRHSQAFEQFRLPTVLPSAYPYGFEPLDVGEENDYAATLGVKGRDLFGFDWNLSTTYGADQVNLSTTNNVNLGMLKSTCVPASVDPTSIYASGDGCGYVKDKFFLKGFTAAQWDNKLDFRRGFTLPFHIPLNLAFGAEHRLETYELSPGEPSSYQLGGPQAIVGLTPSNAGSWSRDIWAGYIDTDFKIMPHWDIDLAGRFEHYTDSGNTENGKISTRYDFSKRIAIRGTVSNGFRAPTLAEQHYSSAALSPTVAGGLLPANSAAARELGATPLKPERSWNLSGGFVLEPIDGFHIEVDAYQIAIRDRLVSSSTYNGTAAVSALESMGFTVPSSIPAQNVTANYITNGASTRTQGVDIKADYTLHLQRYGNLALSAALDLNRTRVGHIASNAKGIPLLNAQAISQFTTEYPRSKLILNALWTIGDFDINIRQSRYGETKSLLTYQDWATGTCADGSSQQYSTKCWYEFKGAPRWLTDLQIGYRVNSHWHVAVGGNNIFNIRPREIPQSTRYNGTNIYDTFAAGIPMTGGYYYGRVDATF